MAFDFSNVTPGHLPAPATAKWSGFPQYNFVGGHNDPDSLPVDKLVASCSHVLQRDGRTLATYTLDSGPQGYLPLREFLVKKLNKYADITCTPDDILLNSGSLQAIDLINEALLSTNDTVIIEASNYGGVITRLQRLNVNIETVNVDEQGMDTNHLAEVLARLQAADTRPAYIYTIPTVHNPTGVIMTRSRREQLLTLAQQFNVPVFEDECYADLIWNAQRPPSLYAMDDSGRVIHVGSFSKTIAPALRVGYTVANWSLLAQLLSLKTDAGSGALEQMLLAEYCGRHFDEHLATLNQNLKAKLDCLCAAIDREFGTTAQYSQPPGGIFLWLKLPDTINTTRLAQVAASEGVAINPGAEWSLQPDAQQHLRICFANPPLATIDDGVKALAAICHREFGLPAFGANTSR